MVRQPPLLRSRRLMRIYPLTLAYISLPSDIWAAGVIFADMLAKKPIMHSKSVKELLTKQVALLGKPDDETIDRMATANYNRQYKYFLLRMEEPAGPFDLSKLFPPPTNEAESNLWAQGLDLLQKILVFDPAKYVARTPSA